MWSFEDHKDDHWTQQAIIIKNNPFPFNEDHQSIWDVFVSIDSDCFQEPLIYNWLMPPYP